jgi:hypothetical protein
LSAPRYRPERVVYVDAGGNEWSARTLERPREGEKTQLLVKLGKALTVMDVRHSEAREGGTWHRPAKPS